MQEEVPHPESMVLRHERQKNPSASRALVFLFVLMMVGVCIAVFVISQRSATGPLVAEDAPDAIPVRIVPVELSDNVLIDEKFTGLATPRRTSMLGFQGGGRIDSIFADIGSRVGKGQRLAVLDTRSLKAQLAAADAVVLEARAARDLAATTVSRQLQLLEKGHVSQQIVDEAQAQVDTANARINAAQAQADTLRVQIDLAQITAPYGGVVTKRFADEGAIAAPGSSIFELVEIGRMEARIGLPAEEAMKLKVGEAYILETKIGPVEATHRATTGVIDANARTVTTVFDIAESKLPAGSVVRLALRTELVERGVWVPIGALTEGNRGLWSVYVAERDGDGWSAQKRPVEIVRAEAERAYVRGALSDGDALITEGITRVAPGIVVSPSEEIARN